MFQEPYYVSQVGSKIIFQHQFRGNDDSLPLLFLDMEAHTLKKCDHIRTSTYFGYDFAYCEITQEDLDYIEKNNAQLYYTYLCDYLIISNIYLYKLDPEKYQVFEVTKFIKPKTTSINNKTDLILVSNSNLNIQTKTELSFYTLLEIENNMKNLTFISACTVPINSENSESYLTCHIGEEGDYQYQNIYLLPYSLMELTPTIFEVIIKESIKAEDEIEPPNEEEEENERREDENEKQEEDKEDETEPINEEEEENEKSEDENEKQEEDKEDETEPINEEEEENEKSEDENEKNEEDKEEGEYEGEDEHEEENENEEEHGGTYHLKYSLVLFLWLLILF